jgi:Patatin-like phospholipase
MTPVFRDGALVKPVKPPIRLFLSGGGQRATIGSAGAICALVDLGVWGDVTEVISVSGGSITNGALVASLPHSEPSQAAPPFQSSQPSQPPPQPSEPGDDDPRPALRGMLERLIADKAGALATGKRKLVMVFFAVATALWLALMAASFGFGPVRLPSGIALVLGVATPVVVVMTVRLGAGWIWTDFVGTIVGGREVSLRASSTSRRYLFCAAGLSSGVPYYFWSHSSTPTVAWGELLQSGYTLTDAVLASTSLPGIGLIHAPEALRREALVDGGVSGIFGQQREVSIQRHAKDTFRGDVIRVAIDAGRHSVAYTKPLAALTRFSVLFALSRWLKASLEATYINDIGDFHDGHLVRLCRDPSMATTPGVHGAALDLARQQTSQLGLFDVTGKTAVEPILAGYVSTRLAFQPAISSEDLLIGLRVTGAALGLGDSLAQRWQELSSAGVS